MESLAREFYDGLRMVKQEGPTNKQWKDCDGLNVHSEARVRI